MASRASYEPVLSAAALAYLVSLGRAKQRNLIHLLTRLAEHPNQPGDYTTHDDTGREIQHLEIGNIVIAYWADHAVRELRIVWVDDM